MPASTRIRAVSVTAAIATALTLGVAGVAYASDGSGSESCVKADGGGLLDVTADVLGAVGINLDVLSGKDSIACAPARQADDKHDPGDDSDDPSCDDFDSQADAQDALDDDEDLAEFLDRDGDGVACEGLFDDDDASNDDDDDDKKSDKKSDNKAKDDDDKSSGGQVKAHPKGGVDTGGFAV